MPMFGPLGAFPLGGDGGASATIFVPVAIVAVASVDARLLAGGTITTPAASIAVSGAAPALAIGSAVRPPATSVGLSSGLVAVPGGGSVRSGTTVSVVANTPALLAGGRISPDPAIVAVDARLSFVVVGAVQNVPAVELTATAPAPVVSGGAAIAAPAALVGVVSVRPNLLSGVAITLSNDQYRGVEGALGEFAWGSSGAALPLGGTVLASAPIPAVVAGAFIVVPVAAVQAILQSGAVAGGGAPRATAPGVQVSAASPVLLAGAAIAAGTAIAVSTPIPLVVGGTRLVVDVQAVAVTMPGPTVSGGGSVAASGIDVAVEGLSPDIRVGSSILINGFIITVAAPVPKVVGGALLLPSAVAVTASVGANFANPGLWLHLPTSGPSLVSAPAPTVSSGAAIRAPVAVTVISNPLPKVVGGSKLSPSALAVTVAVQRPNLLARRRNPSIQAIAS